MLSCEQNLAPHQGLWGGVPAGSPRCCSGAAGRKGGCRWVLLELPSSGTAFCALLAPLATTQWFFWACVCPGAWSHQGREEVFLKTSRQRALPAAQCSSSAPRWRNWRGAWCRDGSNTLLGLGIPRRCPWSSWQCRAVLRGCLGWLHPASVSQRHFSPPFQAFLQLHLE